MAAAARGPWGRFFNFSGRPTYLTRMRSQRLAKRMTWRLGRCATSASPKLSAKFWRDASLQRRAEASAIPQSFVALRSRPSIQKSSQAASVGGLSGTSESR
jgi:hypothetical protein